MTLEALASGTTGPPLLATGTVIEWREQWLTQPGSLAGAVIYDRGPTPLYRMAFIVEHGAAAVLMAEGGRNYHPLILAAEAGVPALAGIGQHDRLVDQRVTVDVAAGWVYAGELPAPTAMPARVVTNQATDTPPVYVNVGYPSGLPAAAASGADGLGLLRTEFAAVKTLALHLDQRLDDGRRWGDLLEPPGGNEADAIYAIAQDRHGREVLKAGLRAVVATAVEQFGDREVIVRTLDIARRLDEPMGNRGIRRCIGSGGATVRLLCEALREVLAERGGRLGLILPLVSHYGQIRATVEQVLASGLTLRREGGSAANQLTFGWEIEQPAAAQNNRLWLAAFMAEFGQPPHLIGIGTNDLTQFTIALGRDVSTQETDPAQATYLGTLYDECDFAVVRQILEPAAQCRQVGTRVLLLGQAGASPLLAPLLFACRITPSVATNRVAEVRRLAAASRQPGATWQAIEVYRERLLASYPAASQATVAQELKAFFAGVVPT